MPRAAKAGVLTFALLAALTSSSWGEIPQADSTFLAARVPAVIALGEMANAVRSPEDALEMSRRLLALRREGLGDLQAKHPLTSIHGIETQDAFDMTVVGALHRLAVAGMIADTTRVDPAHAQVFLGSLGQPPDLGKAPLPFMVLAVAEMAGAAAESTTAAGIPRSEACKIAVYVIGNATDRYFDSREEEVKAASAQNLRESAMVMRLRCPKDGSPYRLNTKKNRVQADGGVVTLFYLQCNTCAEPLLLEFPYELASKLNRMAEKQKLGNSPQPSRPNSVDP